MNLSSYFYVNRGIDVDLPFTEVIKSALNYSDEIIVGSDPRFKDNTILELEKLSESNSKIKLIIKEFNFDVENPHAEIKNELRNECNGDWLLELDADKIIPSEKSEELKRRISQVSDGVYIISLGVVPFFNGNFIKLYDGTDSNLANHKTVQDCISRNLKTIRHGGIERNGAGYVSSKGLPLKAGISFSNLDISDTNDSNIKMFHYGWYCLPRRWEMKQTHHYYEGRREGVYTCLADYVLNKDNEPVDFWDLPWQRTTDHYIGAMIAEMKHPAIRKWKGEHPAIMKGWIERQQERIWVPKKTKKYFNFLKFKNGG